MPRDRGVSKLTMLLGPLTRREDPRRHRLGADQLVHCSVDPSDIEQVILLAFSEKNVLFDVVENTIERVLGDRRQKIKGRFGPCDMHPLDDAPFEDEARLTLLGDEGLGALAVTGLEQRDQLLRLAWTRLLQRHVESRI
jgi:hypothetical protein